MISSLASLPALEAALRALLAAIAVWAGLRLLRVGNVLVQKAAWGLVLVAALAMPLAPNWLAIPALRRPAPARDSAASPMRRTARLLQAPRASHARSRTLCHCSSNRLPNQAQLEQHPPAKAAPNVNRTPPQSALPQAEPAASDRYPAPAILEPAVSIRPHTIGPRRNRAALSPAGARRRSCLCSNPHCRAWLVSLPRRLCRLAAPPRLWIGIRAPALEDCRANRQPAGLRWPAFVSAPARASPRPVNIGSGILLPADYASWDEEKLRIVLAHERSHIRQGDFYLQLLAGFYASLFWFSPLGWWLKRKLSELGEAISDRAGLEEAASRSSYAQLLLEFAALPRPTLTGVAMARTSHLSQRIERLLNESTFRQAFAAAAAAPFSPSCLSPSRSSPPPRWSAFRPRQHPLFWQPRRIRTQASRRPSRSRNPVRSLRLLPTPSALPPLPQGSTPPQKPCPPRPRRPPKLASLA